MKKGSNAIIIAILIPILLIVGVGGYFYAIFHAVTELIVDTISEILNFFSNPVKYFKQLVINLKNKLASWTGGSYTAPPSDYMMVCINEDAVQNIRDSINNVSVDTDKIGLTDNGLKKMVLSYYMSYGTDQTIIYTPIKDYIGVFGGPVIIDKKTHVPLMGEKMVSMGKDVIGFLKGEDNPYFYFWGNGSFGELGKLYLGTTGAVKVYNANMDEMKFYTTEKMGTIITDFKAAIDNGNTDYIESFLDVFNSCYTLNEESVGSVTVVKYSSTGFGNGEYYDFKTIDYRSRISKFAMPTELLTTMLDLTASPDFIEDVADLVQGSELIIRINEERQKTTIVDKVEVKIKDATTNKTYTITTGSSSEETSTDFNLTLGNIECWYCKMANSTIANPYSNTANENVNELYDFDTIAGEYAMKNLPPRKVTDPKTGKETEAAPLYSITSKSAVRTITSNMITYSESVGTHEDNTEEFVELLKKKYSDIYSPDTTTAVPGDLLTNGAKMFFEYLELSPNTTPYSNVMKYILYKYSGEDFGITDFDELLALFNTTDFNGTAYLGDLALAEFLRSYENNWLREYRNGTADQGTINLVLRRKYARENPVTKEIEYGIEEMHYKSDHSLNYSYGLLICSYKNGVRGAILEDKERLFSAKGVNLAERISEYTSGRGAGWVNADIADEVQVELINETKESIIKKYADRGVDLTSNEADALVVVSYGYGNANPCNSGVALLKKYKAADESQKGSIRQEMINNFGVDGDSFHPFRYGDWVRSGRANAIILMFFEGRYLLSTGEEIYPVGSGLEEWDGATYANDQYTFPIYSQSDPRWGKIQYGAHSDKNIGSSGCGCCALSAILSGYLGQAITPDVLLKTLNDIYPAKNYYVYGKGSNTNLYAPKVLERFGCTVGGGGSRSEAIKELQKGNAILGYETGHFLAYVPASSADRAKGYLFMLIDSNRGHGGLYRSFEEADRVVSGSADSERIIYPPKDGNRGSFGGTTSKYGFVFPVRGLTVANINNKNYPSYSGHTGVDININVIGKDVIAAKDGTVTTSTALRNGDGSYRSYGEYIEINHGNGICTRYAHMYPNSRKVSQGQHVKKGQQIGTVGTTGNSTGEHLHFEVRVNGSAVNPLPYLGYNR